MVDVKTTGIAMALLERFETQRLETALEIKKKVEEGSLLSDTDVDFLKEVFEDVDAVEHIVSNHPEWQPIYSQIVSLYHEIMEKALANEKAAH
jgi:hypothetical protein